MRPSIHPNLNHVLINPCAHVPGDDPARYGIGITPYVQRERSCRSVARRVILALPFRLRPLSGGETQADRSALVFDRYARIVADIGTTAVLLVILPSDEIPISGEIDLGERRTTHQQDAEKHGETL